MQHVHALGDARQNTVLKAADVKRKRPQHVPKKKNMTAVHGHGKQLSYVRAMWGARHPLATAHNSLCSYK